MFLFTSHGGEVRTRKIKPCPETPNCVNSLMVNDTKHYVSPFVILTEPDSAWLKVKEVISTLPRTKIVEYDSAYMHVEFKSFLFRFVDDVEFQITDNKIHLRSASRVGYSDLGVNKRRMEKIRVLLQNAGIIK
ncbi:MAG: DUF1499 domain-containing protein [Fibrobacteria bacterium]|nr:DUF1499 domain-containing protein [Fibrobacteria bacterium]